MADSNTAADIYGVPAEQPNLAIAKCQLLYNRVDGREP
jgi:hypothetical protein